jgi:TRAP-type mannitol/chloroaromatic compound transport system substrate-binding protein
MLTGYKLRSLLYFSSEKGLKQEVIVKKDFIFGVLAFILISSLLVVGCAQPAPAPKAAPAPAPAPVAASPAVELKLWSGWATDKWTTKPYMHWWLDKYKDQFKSANITFKYLGGPEVFPNTEGQGALKKGLIDAAFNTTAYFVGILPEGDGMKLSRIQPWDERASGFYDYMNKLCQEKNNAYYSWRLPHDGYFCFWLNEERPKPDLSGLKIRTSPVYTPIIKALGGTPVNMNMDEVYTALERKMVDGYGSPVIGLTDRKWELVTKYKWGPNFYASPTGVWYNLDKWKSLTDQQRKVLDDVAKAAEKDSAPSWLDDQKADWVILQKAGIKEVRFSADEEKKYLDLCYEEGWKDILSKVPEFAKARPMMEKK